MLLLLTFFRPTIDAIFSSLPFRYRWRLLCFQPVAILSNSLNFVPWMFSTRYSVFYIPTRNGQKVRALLFEPPNRFDDKRLRPLHLDIHGGGFLGGMPEANARFCSYLSDKTGAVVVSSTYRFAPRHPYPAAIDDIDDVVEWLLGNAESKFKADPTLLTTGGSSAGGNLALAVCQKTRCHKPATTAVKGSVTFYAPVDLRIPPGQKPVPPDFPKKDPLWWLEPMFNSYASQSEMADDQDPRLHPIVADIKTLPEDMLFIIPAIDILLHEQLSFIKRLKQDTKAAGPDGGRYNVESLVFEKCFHGWLELPSYFIKEQTRTEVFEASRGFIQNVHKKYGFDFKPV